MSDKESPKPGAEIAIREALTRTLLKGDDALPTSFSRRTGQTLMALLRGARLVRRERKRAKRGDEAPIDVEAMTRIVSALGQLKGLAMKMGQMMSYLDVAMPEELQAALSTLQTHAQPMPLDRVRTIISEDLGPGAHALLSRMSELPIAAASIGQVHTARLPDGKAVAVKVRYPEVEQAIVSDFGAARVSARIQAILFPNARIQEFIDEMRTRFLEECDYEHEAAAQRRFRDLFAEHETIVIPAVFEDYCSRRVLTTEYIDGAHFDEHLSTDPSQEQRDRVGEALFEFYIGTLFRHGLYNCDPHPGNYLFLRDGRLAILDYGCTRVFDREFVDGLARLTLAVHADDPRQLHRAFVDVGLVREGRRYDFDVARSLARGFYGPLLADKAQRIDLGEEDFSGIFRKKMQLLKLSLPGEFMFLLRIRYGLMSVLARLGARANWYRLERRYVGV
jgi:predicted unusual protein kinase regulating ubiquinone biosynthesis (AarF/ABC1/UbiB family)